MNKTPSKSKLFTRGGQITFNNLRMLLQVNQKIVHWSLLLIVLLTLCGVWITTSLETIQAAYYYVIAIVLLKVGFTKHVFHFMWHGQSIHVNTIAVLSERYFHNQVDVLMQHLKLSFYGALGLALLLMIWLAVWLIKRGKKQAEKQFVRGARMASNKAVSKMIKKHGASDIRIESVPMAKDFEIKHTLIHGTTGSGKGQTFHQFVEQIRQRGDSAIIFDKGCVFTGLFYREKSDVILNPFDQRCAHWNLWQEATTEPEFENIAESLIHMHGESDPYWVDAARTVFSAVAYRMQAEDHCSIDRLLSLLLTAELDVLGKYLKGTQAATLVSDKIEKTAISIRSVISTYLKSLRFLRGLEDRTPFSIRDWINHVADAEKSHFLFISSNADQHAALRPLISMWLSMASITLLSLEENYDRRIWFICDELPTLHKLPQLGESIAEVRKFGGCFVLGMQSFSQLQKVYGRASAAEIFDLLNTRFFFRSPSADMAALVSKELGQEDVEQSNESYSYGANTIRDGISIGTQRMTRPLVSPSEIMEMEELVTYLRVPAPVPITRIKIPFRKREKISAGFILREMPIDTPSTHSTASDNPAASEAPSAETQQDANDTDKTPSASDERAETHQPIPDEQEGDNTTGNPLHSLQQQEDSIIDKHADKKSTYGHDIELD